MKMEFVLFVLRCVMDNLDNYDKQGQNLGKWQSREMSISVKGYLGELRLTTRWIFLNNLDKLPNNELGEILLSISVNDP